METSPCAPEPPAPELLGTWRGPFVTDGPRGVMQLVIQYEGGKLSLEATMDAEGAPPPGEWREWKAEGTTFSFAQLFGEYDVFCKGRLEAGELLGTIDAYQGGSLVGGGTFSLKKL